VFVRAAKERDKKDSCIFGEEGNKSDNTSNATAKTSTTAMGGERTRFTRRKVALFVTGFGAFGGVPCNPTELIVKELLARYPVGSELVPGAVLAGAEVVEVSGVGTLRYLARIQHEVTTRAAAGEAVVLLHLGVNSRATAFALERTAYNRVPFSSLPFTPLSLTRMHRGDVHRDA